MLFCGSLGIAFAGLGSAPADINNQSTFQEWWNGKHVTGDWFGVRDELRDHGIKIGGDFRMALFGVVASQNGSRSYWGEEIVFSGGVDFSKLLGVDAIEGLEGFAEGRWRQNDAGLANPNETVEGSSLFNATPWSSGVGWRMLSFGLQYKTPELFGAKDFLTIKGGWLRPQKEFVEQPLSKLFMNNAINSSKGGLGGNIPFSSSFSTWGGTLQVKLLKWHYTKVGLFMSFPFATATDNHGLNFQGDADDPSQNKVFFMGETGFTPEIGAAKLTGKYAFGAYVYGEDSQIYGSNKYGFYWQADQVLFREPSSASSGETSDGKSLGAPVKVDANPESSNQGLRFFSLFTCAPAYNNNYPFYIHTGLAYEGLIPTRERDQLFAGVAFGQYANKPGANNTVVIEGGYRVQLKGWAYVQPYAQYISQPAGTSQVANAAVLGFLAGVDF